MSEHKHQVTVRIKDIRELVDTKFRFVGDWSAVLYVIQEDTTLADLEGRLALQVA